MRNMKCFLLASLLFIRGYPTFSARNFQFEKEFECFSQEKIYHEPTDSCYKLLTTGPCERGYWFVLEKPDKSLRGMNDVTINAKCETEICSNGEYYWKKTNSCVRTQDKMKLCSDATGEELLTNVFGEAECTCNRDPPRSRLNGDVRNRCHLLYTRGPCPRAHIFGFPERSEHATCIRDPCHEESFYKKRKGIIGEDASLVLWQNGACYELGTRGPCPEGFIFKLHPTSNLPNCETFFKSDFR